MRRLLTRAFSVPGGYSRHQDQAAAGTGSLSSFLTHIFSISKPKNMAVCVLCQNTKCSFKFPNIHRMELLVYPFSKDTCLVADACAPARPCRSIRHGQCRALGVQDVGSHWPTPLPSTASLLVRALHRVKHHVRSLKRHVRMFETPC